MARGADAKQYVENKIREAFGKDFVGVDTATKKIYVNGYENGEVIQVAISMTCPKTPFAVPGSGDFEITGDFSAPDTFQPAEITKEETENIRKLIAEFGL